VIALLLDTYGVDVDWQDNKGRTPLFLAAESGNEAAVWLLLRTNAVDPDSKDSICSMVFINTRNS
jgi:ankyrin repeat protein